MRNINQPGCPSAGASALRALLGRADPPQGFRGNRGAVTATVPRGPRPHCDVGEQLCCLSYR